MSAVHRDLDASCARRGARWMGLAGPVLLLVLGALLAPTARAQAQDPVLTVNKVIGSSTAITGGSTITSSPAGITCGSDCTEAYPVHVERVCESEPGTDPFCFDQRTPQTVTLTRGTVEPGWEFVGWNAPCPYVNTVTCEVTVSEDTVVKARYLDIAPPTVALTAPTASVVSGDIKIPADASDNDRVLGVNFRIGTDFAGLTHSAPYAVGVPTESFPDGPTTFKATAWDRSGRTATAERPVTIDNDPPKLDVRSGPNGQTFAPGSTQSWTFAASDAGTGVRSVECRLDAGAYGACSGGSTGHTVSGLAHGSHQFSVRATDNLGRTTEITRSFQIDGAPPETTIDGGLADGATTTATSATWPFSANEPGVNFACRVFPAALTPPSFAPCSDATSHAAAGFSPGTYTFEVRATDAVGNVDPTPARRTFTVTAATTGGGTQQDPQTVQIATLRDQPPVQQLAQPGAPARAAVLGPAARAARADRRGTVALPWRVACPPGGQSCSVRLRATLAKGRRALLGASQRTVAAGTTSALKLRLSRAGLATLRRLKRTTSAVSIKVTVSGQTTTRAVRLTLSAPARR